MQRLSRSLAVAAPMLLFPLLWSGLSDVSLAQETAIQVRHHRSTPRNLPPVGSQVWITTPSPNARWQSYNSQNFGASPGQPGSPTYAPYAGLPPIRSYSNRSRLFALATIFTPERAAL